MEINLNYLIIAKAREQPRSNVERIHNEQLGPSRRIGPLFLPKVSQIAIITLISKLVSIGDATIKFWDLASLDQPVAEHSMDAINGFDSNQTS